MNAKMFREWIFNFTNVDFWHFSIPHKLEMIKKKNLGSFLEQGWGQGDGKETALNPVL